MNEVDELVPSAPEWQLDWQSITERFEEIQLLQGCPQEPAYHGEGDVWVHTRMVCEALIADDTWRLLPTPERELIFWAAVFHDIGKPAKTKHVNGRITSRGHSKLGETMSRSLLWKLGFDFTMREQICALISHHQVPFFLINRDDPLRMIAQISVRTRCDWLAILARADATGRIADDQARILENVELFAAFADEKGCLRNPFPFSSDHSRFEYFRKPDRDPYYDAFDNTRLTVTLLSGLPASGKDTWIEDNANQHSVLSLDQIRTELGIPHGKRQGQVIQTARERAKGYLRRKQDFIYNATNISKEMRSRWTKLFADYNAKIKTVYIETSPHDLLSRNRSRAMPVPEDAIFKMIQKWEVPDLTESHQLDFVIS